MKYKTYSKMKDSEIEWIRKIPDDWKTPSVSKMYEIQLGKMLQPNPESKKDVLMPYLKAEHVHWEHIKTENLPKMWAKCNEIEKYSVKKGDLLVCEGGEGGRCAFLSKDIEKCIFQNALHRVNGKKKSNLKYLMYLLISCNDLGWFDVINNKATIEHFSKEKFSTMKIPFPSVNEQENISKFLESEISFIASEIFKNQRLLEILKEKKVTIINNAVTKGIDDTVLMKDSGVGWIGEIPEKWIVKKLKFSVENRREKQKKESKNLSYVGLENVESKTGRLIDVNKEMTDSDAKLFVKNDVLFGKLRPYLAKVLLTEFDGSCSGEFLVLRGITYVPKFLKYLLLSEGCNKIIVSSTYGAKMPRAEWSFIGNMLFPSTEENEQKRISDFLEKEISKIYNLSSKTKLEIKKLQEFRRSLISLTVTGKIDVTSLVQ